MTRYVFLALFMIIVFVQCNTMNNKERKIVSSNEKFDEQLMKKYFKDYELCLSVFPKDLIDFIPKPNDKKVFIKYSTDIELGSTNKEQYEYWFECYLKLSDLEIDSIINTKKFIKSYLAIDTTPLLIFSYFENPFRFQEINCEDPERIAIQNMNKSKEFPIILFDLNNNKTFTGLHPSFSINILDAKPGIYTDLKNLKTNEYLPPNWKHGYSRGISLSRELGEGIFWIVVW